MPAARHVKTTFDLSAGGVIYRFLDGALIVGLIRTPPNGHWQLPKGLVEKDESLEAAALREVQEETGLEGFSEGLIDKIEYWFWLHEGDQRERHHKVVYFYLLKYRSGHTDNHDQEVEEACWLTSEVALERLSFPSEKKIMQKALEMINIRGSS